MPAPDLCPASREALEAWAFCQGWNPERIAYAAAWLGCADVERLTYLLAAIRDRIAAWEAAQRKAREAR